MHEKFDGRAVAELEAESTAFIVLSTLGIDSSDYSFGYVASWAGGGDQATAGIKASCERIQKAQRPSFEPVEQETAAKAAPPGASLIWTAALGLHGLLMIVLV
ncbi:MAG: hypothetical protein ACYCV7_05615 [Acidimicrobiales bacterium]